ncbi:hypothetical protein [Actinoplanes sp. NPDC048796]|uniref:hypothetical protein n=1 Tax=unclassified Actinoplanes TaxID=2626549 RepID=UPI0033C76E6A
MTWSHTVRGGLATLVVEGTLTTASSEMLQGGTIGMPHRNAGGLLVDLSGLAVADDDAVLVFAGLVARALSHPEVLVVVCAPAVEVMRLLCANGLDPRLVFDSVAAGRAALLADAPAMTEDLLPVTRAARQARGVVTEACLRWDEPDLVGPAALVASELVTNAAMHAHTMMTMQVRLRPCHVRIAVFDGSGRPAVARPPGDSGRGLHLVDAVSAAWGSTALPTGKVVWAALSRGTR